VQRVLRSLQLQTKVKVKSNAITLKINLPRKEKNCSEKYLKIFELRREILKPFRQDSTHSASVNSSKSRSMYIQKEKVKPTKTCITV